MGAIGGGVAVSSIAQSRIGDRIVSLYRGDDEEDSWSDFFRSSINSIKRSVKREVRACIVHIAMKELLSD